MFTPRPAARLLRPALYAVAAATAGNLLLLGLAHAIGANLTFADMNGNEQQVTAIAVALFTVVPMLLGFGLAALIRNRRGLLIGLAVVAAVFTLVSLQPPLAVETDLAARLSLALMHLVAGAAYLVVVGRRIRQLGAEQDSAATTAPAARVAS